RSDTECCISHQHFVTMSPVFPKVLTLFVSLKIYTSPWQFARGRCRRETRHSPRVRLGDPYLIKQVGASINLGVEFERLLKEVHERVDLHRRGVDDVLIGAVQRARGEDRKSVV